MSEVDETQNIQLENGNLPRLIERINRFTSHRVQLNREEGILRINLEFNLNDSWRFRKLAESVFIELLLFLVENAATRYSFMFNRLANSVFLLYRILGRNVNLDVVDPEKWDSLVSNFNEISQIIQNQSRSITSNINLILVLLYKTLGNVRNWLNDTYNSKPMLSKL